MPLVAALFAPRENFSLLTSMIARDGGR